MANVTRQLMSLNEGLELTAGESQSAKFNIEATGGDYKTLILITNAGATKATATFSVGNGIQGAGEDLVVDVKGNKTVALTLDSGYFKNVSGENKGCITCTPSATLTFQCIELPQ